MNAFDLEQAAFDSANDYVDESVQYLQQYADGAFGIAVTDDVCRKILSARAAYRAATEHNGEGQNNHFWLVREQLEAIEL